MKVPPELKIVKDPTMGLSSEQQERLVETFGKVLEQRLNNNHGQRLTEELKVGLYQMLMGELEALTKSVVPGYRQPIPGVQRDGAPNTPALTDDEVDDLIVKPGEEQ